MGTFNIVAFGPPGSGKTVYLGALYRVIGNRSVGRGIFFTIEDGQKRKWLERIYDKVADPNDEEWPPSTNTIEPPREFEFTCRVQWTEQPSWPWARARLRTYDVFRLIYIDYAGDWLTEADRVPMDLYSKFKKWIEDADALLGIIDGVMLRRHLDGDAGGLSFFRRQLVSVLSEMQGVAKPMHFVLTKCDVLKDYSLENISRTLLLSPDTGFNDLIESRTARRRKGRTDVGEVRLIPVSSVGDFAELGPDWRMRKVGGELRHVNVEVPVIAALLDVCDLALSMQLRAAASSRPQTSRWSRQTGASGDASQGQVTIGRFGLTFNLRDVIGFTLDAGMVGARLLDRPARSLGRRMRRTYRRVQARGIEGVRSEEGAMLYVAHVFRARLSEFDMNPAYRGSRLIPSVQGGDLPEWRAETHT